MGRVLRKQKPPCFYLIQRFYFDIMYLMKRIDELLENIEKKINKREKKKKPKMKVSGKSVFQIKKIKTQH